MSQGFNTLICTFQWGNIKSRPSQAYLPSRMEPFIDISSKKYPLLNSSASNRFLEWDGYGKKPSWKMSPSMCSKT